MSEKCRLLWREARLEVNMLKAYHARTTFGSCGMEKGIEMLEFEPAPNMLPPKPFFVFGIYNDAVLNAHW